MIFCLKKYVLNLQMHVYQNYLLFYLQFWPSCFASNCLNNVRNAVSDNLIFQNFLGKIHPDFRASSRLTPLAYWCRTIRSSKLWRYRSDKIMLQSSGQVLNVITFLTKTKLSRQVRDILKKTKGVIISTIALHVLLASWYISRHGRLVQTSNNQAGPRGEKF